MTSPSGGSDYLFYIIDGECVILPSSLPCKRVSPFFPLSLPLYDCPLFPTPEAHLSSHSQSPIVHPWRRSISSCSDFVIFAFSAKIRHVFFCTGLGRSERFTSHTIFSYFTCALSVNASSLPLSSIERLVFLDRYRVFGVTAFESIVVFITLLLSPRRRRFARAHMALPMKAASVPENSNANRNGFLYNNPTSFPPLLHK